METKKMKYYLRKSSYGLASIAAAAFLVSAGSVVSADEATGTGDVVTTTADAQATTEANDVVTAATSESTEVATAATDSEAVAETVDRDSFINGLQLAINAAKADLNDGLSAEDIQSALDSYNSLYESFVAQANAATSQSAVDALEQPAREAVAGVRDRIASRKAEVAQATAETVDRDSFINGLQLAINAAKADLNDGLSTEDIQSALDSYNALYESFVAQANDATSQSAVDALEQPAREAVAGVRDRVASRKAEVASDTTNA
ncbi:YSIRK-type signal peptide-containing protein [Streptococcus saliviloxodontae]|uniref:Signal recognition particle receptor subunit beta n=1 Tax=Streptococcus saliviloxodontae TaxID=1349416 RepID=A0ABS2PMD0_9STRE|nr:YSIRK-type signal peptide-containing protein [Streptococcus saliviloxodontae]MBM7636590.1 signal recognition particle receptor subunit beta [Streptococcus saliviloxodontae]